MNKMDNKSENEFEFVEESDWSESESESESEPKTYEVLVEEVHIYSYTVVAKNKEDALEKYEDDVYDDNLVDCVKITRMDPYSCEEIPSKD